MPWKNGGGQTTEIAMHPPGAALDAFAWRVSVADVEQDGPFSRFAGIDRTLVLLAGAGMRLTGDGEPLELRTPLRAGQLFRRPNRRCSLVDGPVRDFNLMVRRGSGTRRRRRPPRGRRGASRRRDTYVCYAASGASECLLAGHPPIALAEAHALLVTSDDGGAHVGSASIRLPAGAVALVAVIRFA